MFSLDTDPTEVNNVFEEFPEVVHILLQKLSVYDKNSVPTFYPPRDPGNIQSVITLINPFAAADPDLHDGWWGPWKEKPNDWPRL